MSVREEVYNYLLTISSLTDIIGTRLYYVECHETPEYPMIIYKEFSRPTSYQTDDQWQRWRFNILAEDSLESAGRRIALFGRLTEEHKPIKAIMWCQNKSDRKVDTIYSQEIENEYVGVL